MQIMGLGLNRSGARLFPAADEATFAQTLASALVTNGEDVSRLSNATLQSRSFRSTTFGQIVRRPVDPGDVAAMGWTYLVRAGHPQRAAIDDAIKPLAAHRGMAQPIAPLQFKGEDQDAWSDWLHDCYYALEMEGKTAPRYILIVGGPDAVPFAFQSFLDTVANVGRIDFDAIEDLERYVAKIIRIETAAAPIVSNQTVFFAPDGGPNDPTYFSRAYMAKPLADHVRDTLKFPTTLVDGDAATKASLVSAITEKRPALLYTASHGLGAMPEALAIQKQWNGAICCQHQGNLTANELFAAHDVPDGPFLEGAVVFQFACFGYGTPAISDYSHWLKGVPEKSADADFVAALPKKLLAHERGPIAFVGHLDTAFLHGFADPHAPHALDRWDARVAPFKKAIERFLAVDPSGYAMEDMSQRYSVCNAILTSTYDRQKRGSLTWTPELQTRFLDTWITRSDAQNYMVYGDPAVQLRIPTD